MDPNLLLFLGKSDDGEIFNTTGRPLSPISHVRVFVAHVLYKGLWFLSFSVVPNMIFQHWQHYFKCFCFPEF